MDKMKTAPLTELATRLAFDAVHIQQKMDTQFESDIQHFKKLLAQTPAEYKSHLKPLAPKRQVVSRHEVKARLQLNQEKKVGVKFSLGVQLMNISADIRFQRNTKNDCQLNICIEQIPFQLED